MHNVKNSGAVIHLPWNEKGVSSIVGGILRCLNTSSIQNIVANKEI